MIEQLPLIKTKEQITNDMIYSVNNTTNLSSHIQQNDTSFIHTNKLKDIEQLDDNQPNEMHLLPINLPLIDPMQIVTEPTTQQQIDDASFLSSEEDDKNSILSKKNKRLLNKHKAMLAKIKLTRRKTLLKPYEPMYNRHGQQTYCLCRKPDDGDIMIQCDTCREW